MPHSRPAVRLSIVIATFNSDADIARCLLSLRSAPPRTTHEIIVVDNASTDATCATIRATASEVGLIESPSNLGFAAANNLGIRRSQGELLLLLNPDTRVEAGAIDLLVAHLDRRPDAAACGPRLIDGEGRAELSFGRMIGPWAELRQRLLVHGQAARWPIISSYVEAMTRTEGEPDWVSGACLLVRRADAEAAGLLDERYFLYAEDVDFCAALRSRGRKILFTPDATVTHLRGRSRASAASAAEQAYRRSQLAFYAKHHPAWVPILGAYLRLRGRYPA